MQRQEIVNRTIYGPEIPEAFKRAVVKPLRKTNGAYRPVSMLNTVDKLCQIYAEEKIYDHLHQCGAISKKQFAYQEIFQFHIAL